MQSEIKLDGSLETIVWTRVRHQWTWKLETFVCNHKEEDETYPLTTIEIAKAQMKDKELKIYYTQNAKTPEKDMHFQLVEDAKVL